MWFMVVVTNIQLKKSKNTGLQQEKQLTMFDQWAD